VVIMLCGHVGRYIVLEEHAAFIFRAEMLVSTYKSTLCYNLEDEYLHRNCLENPKTHC
jgi:hypothetical protein